MEHVRIPETLSQEPTSMDDWQAHIAEDVLRVAAPQQLSNTLPAVLHCVKLLEVILTTIRWQLQLRPFIKVPRQLAAIQHGQ